MLGVKATLRVTSKEYLLAEIESYIGKPTKGFSIGDSYGKSERKREHTYWGLESTRPSSDSLESHLNELLDYIDDRATPFGKMDRNFQKDIFCMLSTENGQGGTMLTPHMMRRMSDWNMAIVFDVYSE